MSTFLIPLLLACRSPEPAPPETPARPPNVLLVTLDTLRVDALGSFGGQPNVSPNLDALARESVRFTRAYTVTPLTIPSHSSIMTGMLPPRHGVRDNGDFFLSEGAITLAERLKGAGYRTMAAVGAEVTSHHWGFAQGFDAYFDDMGGSVDEEQNRWRVERRGDKVVDDALGWLEQNGTADAPFFAWVHLFDVHHPYVPPEPFASRYADRPYLGEVAWTDSQVGRLLSWLQQKGLSQNTAIVVTADHGEGLGSHGEAFHGVLLYDATTHIPLIVRPPAGLSVPARVAFPVSLVDLAPTVLGLTGLPAAEGIDGMDLSRWLVPPAAAPAAPPDRAVYLEALYGWRHYGWAPQRALVTDDAKLIDSTTPELYARDDLREENNLATIAAAQVESLKARIATLTATLTPDATMSAEAEMSPERMAQLEALGYMTSGEEVKGEGFGEGLPDPVNRLPSLGRLEEARAAVQAGDPVAAEKVIRELIATEPGLSQAHMMLAGALVGQKRLDEAMEVYVTMESRSPTANVKVAMAALELRRGRLERAATLLAAAVEQDPFLATAWSSYLNVLYTMGDNQRLKTELARAQQRIPDLPAALALQGTLAAGQGEFLRAESLLLRALARDPLLPGLNHGLGLVAQAKGQVDAAEAAFLEELRTAPPAVASRRELAALYAQQDRFDEQLQQIDVLLKLRPEEESFLHARAQALYNLKRFSEANEAVDRCLAVAPRFPACKMLQANALKKLGREEEAELAYKEALRLAKEAKGQP